MLPSSLCQASDKRNSADAPSPCLHPPELSSPFLFELCLRSMQLSALKTHQISVIIKWTLLLTPQFFICVHSPCLCLSSCWHFCVFVLCLSIGWFKIFAARIHLAYTCGNPLYKFRYYHLQKLLPSPFSKRSQGDCREEITCFCPPPDPWSGWCVPSRPGSGQSHEGCHLNSDIMNLSDPCQTRMLQARTL